MIHWIGYILAAVAIAAVIVFYAGMLLCDYAHPPYDEEYDLLCQYECEGFPDGHEYERKYMRQALEDD